MVYIAAGRSLYGSGDDEATRGFLTHQPVHDVDVGPFLIARTEVTNGEYLAFLGALPESERKGRLPSGALAPERRAHRVEAPQQGPRARGAVLQRRGAVRRLVAPAGQRREPGGRRALRRIGWHARVACPAPGSAPTASGSAPRAARTTGSTRAATPTPPRRRVHAWRPTAATRRAQAPARAGTHPASRSPFGVDDLAGSESEWTSGPPDVAQPRKGPCAGAGLLRLRPVPRDLEPRVHGIAIALRRFGLRVCSDVR